MRKGIFIICVVLLTGGVLYAQAPVRRDDSGKPIRFTAQIGYPIYLAGYKLEEEGDGVAPDPDVERMTQNLSSRLNTNLFLGFGQQLIPELFWAFRFGLWTDSPGFNLLRFTSASAFFAITPLAMDVAPLATVGGGLYQEWMGSLGFFFDPSVGVAVNQGEGRKLYVTVGYLFTSYSTDIEDDLGYWESTEEASHFITINVGYIL